MKEKERLRNILKCLIEGYNKEELEKAINLLIKELKK